MRTIGLTGGIGSGKSLVANIFMHLGVPVFNSDDESKKALDHNLKIRDQLAEWFGPALFKDDLVDRAKLAGIIFSDPVQLARVNELIHPVVMDRFVKWCGKYHETPYVIHEAAILFESGFFRRMNDTILVTAPEEIRMARVRQRDRISGELVRQRMQNQWSDEQKVPLAGFIIHNDGTTPLIPQILDIHNKLIS
jgi:dephospho-CoA kinase